MKRPIALILGAALTLALAACGGTPAHSGSSAGSAAAVSSQVPRPADLTGTWEQTNKNAEDSYHTATITEDTITVNWQMGEDTRAIYWVGTFSAPDTADEPYTWESVNDHEQTELSLLASDADTKDFTYADGVLSYDCTAMGITMTVKLEKVG